MDQFYEQVRYNANCFQEKLDRFINVENFFPFFKWSNVWEQVPLKDVCEIDTSMLSNLVIYQENIFLKDCEEKPCYFLFFAEILAKQNLNNFWRKKLELIMPCH